MPAKRKSTEFLEASGAYAKNPSRRRKREAEIEAAGPLPEGPLGDPPQEWVDGAEHNARLRGLLQAWHEIVAQSSFGKLTRAHRIHVENTCYLIYKIRRASMGYGKATSGDSLAVNKFLAQMRMVPSELGGPAPAPTKAAAVASEWAKLASEQEAKQKRDASIQ